MTVACWPTQSTKTASRASWCATSSRDALPQPELPRGVLQNMAFSPDGRSSRSACRLRLRRATCGAGTSPAPTSRAGRRRSSADSIPAKLAEPELVRFKSFDGLSVPAFVYRPAGIAADVRTPVIIDIHGGPEGQTRPSWNAGAQYFAACLAPRSSCRTFAAATVTASATCRSRQRREARGQRQGHRRAARLDRDAARASTRIASSSTASPTVATCRSP